MWPWATWIGKQGSETTDSSPSFTIWLVVGSDSSTRIPSSRSTLNQNGAHS